MAEDNEFIPYKDISELKKELEGMQDKKDVSTKELYDAVHKLSNAMSDMLEVFGAAAGQLKLEEKGYEAETKKHEMIISKLDKLIDQNKTIAEGMVAIVDMVKEKFPNQEKGEPMFKQQEPQEPLFKHQQEQRPFMNPQPEWQPKPEPVRRAQPMQMASPPMAPPPMSASTPFPDYGMKMPPMQPEPMPDLDLEEPFGLDEEPKKKGLFGVFKK